MTASSFLRRAQQCMASAFLIGIAATTGAEVFHPAGDVFAQRPPSDSADDKPVCATAAKYVELINAGRYSELQSLFAEDAVFLTPVGKVLHGRDEIGDFYTAFLDKAVPEIVAISYIADGRECVMELAARTSLDPDDPNADKYQLGAIDHFTMNDDGEIAHMVVYVRPASLVRQEKATAAEE